MKILQINNFYKFFGGSDKVVLNEETLLRNHNEQVIKFYKHSSEIDNYSFFQKILILKGILCNRKYLHELKILIEKEKPDVAHIHNIYPLLSIGIYKMLFSCKIPAVQTFHDHRLSILCPQGNAYRHNQPCELCHKGDYFSCIKNKCVKNNFALSAAYTAAVFQLNKREILNRYLSAGIVLNDYLKDKIIRIGINPEILHYKPHFLAEDAGKVEYDKSDFMVYIGAVSKHKGLFTLLKAYDDPSFNIKLKIIGNGDDVEQLKNQIKNNKNIEYMGEIKSEKRFDIIKRAFCLVQPSECFETFGLTIMEAFACATPVIGSRIGGIPYIIDDEVNGLLFSTGDHEDLKKKILYLYNNSTIQRKMAEQARSKFLNNYSSDGNYVRLKNIYQFAIDYFNHR